MCRPDPTAVPSRARQREDAALDCLSRTLGRVPLFADALRLFESEMAGQDDAEPLELSLALSELASLSSALLRAGDEREEELEAVFAALEALGEAPAGRRLAADFLARLDPEVLGLVDAYLHLESGRLLAAFLGEAEEPSESAGE